MSVERATERIREVYARRRVRVPDARYSFFDRGYLALAQERERAIVACLERHALLPLAERDLLEVGCGSGYWLRELVKYGARPDRLWGIDLLRDSLERARELCAPGVRLAQGNGCALPFADGQFDLVLQSTVFSSVLEREVRERLARELVRVLRPGGAVLWYDARVPHPGNRDLTGIGARELAALFPNCAIAREPITLAPPIARLIAPRSLLLCQLLGKLAPLCTHYLAIIRKPR
jgi:SAM-dependent methyltransferase